jgi:hypothetical protein
MLFDLLFYFILILISIGIGFIYQGFVIIGTYLPFFLFLVWLTLISFIKKNNNNNFTQNFLDLNGLLFLIIAFSIYFINLYLFN